MSFQSRTHAVRPLHSVAAGVLITLGLASAYGADCTWTGTADNSWQTAANWADQKIPTAQDTAVFSASEHVSIELNTDAAVAGITFSPKAVAPFTISGHTLTLADGATILKSAGPAHKQIITSDIQLAGSATFINDDKWAQFANTLILGGKITGSGTITIAGDAKSGGGVLFRGDSSKTFTGTVQLHAGVLLIGKNDPFAGVTHPIILQGGKLFCEEGLKTHGDFSVTGNVTWLSNGPSFHSGNISIDQGAICTFSNGGPLNIDGVIAGQGTITMTEGNTILGGSAANTFTGKFIDADKKEKDALRLNKTGGAIAIAGDLELKNKANVIWQADNQISEQAGITLGGGQLSPNGHSNKLGVLTIDGDAVINLSGGKSMLHFADCSAAAWKDKGQLTIRDWSDSAGSGIYFGNSSSALTENQLSMIGFENPPGKPAGLYHGQLSSTGELTPADKVVQPINPPFDLSEAAQTAREALYDIHGLDKLTGAGTPLVKGTHISIFGDSITWLNGYVTTIDNALAKGKGTHDLDIKVFNHGINGGGVLQVRDGSPTASFDGRSNNGPQEAFAKVIEADHAQIAVVYIGINDVWWRKTTPADFGKAMRDIAASAKAHGTKLVLVTMSVHGEKPDGSNGDDKKIEQFVQITRDVAAATGATLVDLRKEYIAYLQNKNYELQPDGSLKFKPNGILTYDGVHPSDPAGRQLLAESIAQGIYDCAKNPSN